MYIAARKDRSSKGLGTLGGGGAGSREDVKVLKIDLNLMGKVGEGRWRVRPTRGRRGRAGGRGRRPTRTSSSRTSEEFSFIPKRRWLDCLGQWVVTFVGWLFGNYCLGRK